MREGHLTLTGTEEQFLLGKGQLEMHSLILTFLGETCFVIAVPST